MPLGIGDFALHRINTELGPGRVETLDGRRVTLLFRKTEPRAGGGDHQRLIDAVLRPLPRPTPKAEHAPPRSFRRAEPLAVEIAVEGPVDAVMLLYRRTNQVEP